MKKGEWVVGTQSSLCWVSSLCDPQSELLLPSKHLHFWLSNSAPVTMHLSVCRSITSWRCSFWVCGIPTVQIYVIVSNCSVSSWSLTMVMCMGLEPGTLNMNDGILSCVALIQLISLKSPCSRCEMWRWRRQTHGEVRLWLQGTHFRSMHTVNLQKTAMGASAHGSVCVFTYTHAYAHTPQKENKTTKARHNGTHL